MKPTLMDLHRTIETLPELTSSKIFEGSRFSKTGLFSQQIFGPIKSFSCACNKLNSPSGRALEGEVCRACNVELISSTSRRNRFARVKLPFPILNPIFYSLITANKSSVKKVILDLINYKYKYYFDKDGKLQKCRELPEDIDLSTIEILEGLDGILKFINTLIESDSSNEVYQYIIKHYDQITIDNVLVIPPDLRPCERRGSNKGHHIADEINQLYLELIMKGNQIKLIPFTLTTDNHVYKSNYRHIQNTVIKIYEFVLNKLSKKNGLIRSNILGKRVDFSGRAVISPNPTLKIDECKVPYWMILEILKPQLTSHLVNRKLFKRYNKAAEHIDTCLQNRSTELFDIVQEYCEDKVCVLNRQPTLHRLSVLGFKVRVHLGNTIQIHPMVTNGFNADFDGDCSVCNADLIKEGQIININIADVKDREDLFIKYNSKTKENGIIIDKYKPTSDTYINSIDPKTGNYENKKITQYTVHHNIEMYKIHDKENRFEDFWTSYDHSLIVFDENLGEIVRTSPKELLENPEGKYLIKENK